MAVAEQGAADAQAVFRLLPCLAAFAQAQVDAAQAVQGHAGLHRVGPRALHRHGQRALGKRQRLAVVAAQGVPVGHVGHAGLRLGAVFAEGRQAYPVGALQVAVGFFHAAHAQQQHAHVAHAPRMVGAVLTRGAGPRFHGLPRIRQAARIFLGLQRHAGQVGQAGAIRYRVLADQAGFRRQRNVAPLPGQVEAAPLAVQVHQFTRVVHAFASGIAVVQRLANGPAFQQGLFALGVAVEHVQALAHAQQAGGDAGPVVRRAASGHAALEQGQRDGRLFLVVGVVGLRQPWRDDGLAGAGRCRLRQGRYGQQQAQDEAPHWTERQDSRATWAWSGLPASATGTATLAAPRVGSRAGNASRMAKRRGRLPFAAGAATSASHSTP